MDPDYEQYGEASKDGNTNTASTNAVSDAQATEKQISDVLNTQISAEIEGLENDIYEVDKRLSETRLILDRLRAAMLISYYNRVESTGSQQSQSNQHGIHPAVKTAIGKSIPGTSQPLSFKSATKSAGSMSAPKSGRTTLPSSAVLEKSKHRIIVGNVSKYIPVDMRQRNDQVSYSCTSVGELQLL